jgi:integrase
MARPTTGSVTTHKGKDGRTYRYLRFVAYGKRQNVRLGPVSEAEAQTALRHTLADVERGNWTPPKAIEPPAEPVAVQTFHAFAEEWWTLRKGQLSANTQADYWWRLTVHLLPYFGPMALDAITFDTVERYIAAKLAEDAPLSARSINMTVTLLAAILERAHKRKLIDGNHAKDRDLRVPERAPTRSYLDSAAQISALLTAAGELDAEAPRDRRHVKRRAMIATLTFAGLRIGELIALPLDLIDLAAGWLDIDDAKTDAGRRRVKVRGALHDELASVKADAAPGQRLAFPTRTGGPMSPDNFRNRVLAAVVKRANENLAKEGRPPLPGKLTPHSLRRTFCSLLYALGEDPGVVMDEMGHTDPALALRVYRQAMRRGEDEKAALRALVEGGVMANSGKRDEIETLEHSGADTEEV